MARFQESQRKAAEKAARQLFDARLRQALSRETVARISGAFRVNTDTGS